MRACILPSLFASIAALASAADCPITNAVATGDVDENGEGETAGHVKLFFS